MGAREGIQHVIVLMLENRSFDSMLGTLYPDKPEFEGLGKRPELHVNYYHPSLTEAPQEYCEWSDEGLGPTSVCIPEIDPGESFNDITQQIFGLYATPTSDKPPLMNGFIDNYIRQATEGIALSPDQIMHSFSRKQLPVLSELATKFGVCDQWYASAPCQTWPNRAFTHCATSHGKVNNDQFLIHFEAPSIFSRLTKCNKDWKVYYHDIPNALMLNDVRPYLYYGFQHFDQFLLDAGTGDLPHYSFIEPRYFSLGLATHTANDAHPPHDIAFAEQLIAQVYNAVRNSPAWKRTLLIITCDEHGGCYDHMPPPKAVSPDAYSEYGFAFDRYGVRVPAVIVSPYIYQGLIVKSGERGIKHDSGPVPFDHTSIIATLRDLFELGAPLTKRDESAPSLLSALTLLSPDNDGPDTVTANSTNAIANELGDVPLNNLQKHLLAMTDWFQITEEYPGQTQVLSSSNITVLQAGEIVTQRTQAYVNSGQVSVGNLSRKVTM